MTPKHFAELALRYEKQCLEEFMHPEPTLQGFAQWLLDNDTKVKPDDNGPETPFGGQND